jgi:hypothetical protein
MDATGETAKDAAGETAQDAAVGEIVTDRGESG